MNNYLERTHERSIFANEVEHKNTSKKLHKNEVKE